MRKKETDDRLGGAWGAAAGYSDTGGVTPVYAASALQIAPRYAGTVVGIQSAIANLAGVLAPVVIGYLVKSFGWASAFWLTAAVSTCGIVVFLLFGKAERLVE